MALKRELVVRGSQHKAPRYYHDVGNGEFFVVRTGVTYSNPTIHNYYVRKHGQFNDYNFTPRLRPDVDEIMGLLAAGQSVITEGDLGAGKSTVLFGVRRLLREAGKEYIYVDGHFINKPEPIAAAIRRINPDSTVILHDSFDYLFRSRKYGRSNKARDMIQEPLTRHVLNGGGLVATAHTEPWFRRFSTPELHSEYESTMGLLGFAQHRVTGYIGDETEMHALAVDLSGEEFAEQYLQYAAKSELPTSRTYRVMKQMSLSGLQLVCQKQFDDLVTNIDNITRIKMGAPDDYQLGI
jgi:hypothetical protein